MANTLPIWPTSPTPQPLGREIQWGESLTVYDTGASQGTTAWTRELYKWSIRIGNNQFSTISSLIAFHNDRKGRVRPFFFSDPYDFRINSQQMVGTGTAVTTIELLHPVGSYHVYPNSAFFTTLTSNLSGTLSAGVDYSLDHDSGFVTLVVSPNSDDFITVNSTQFYRKTRFSRNYSDQSRIWQIFDVQIELMEIP